MDVLLGREDAQQAFVQVRIDENADRGRGPVFIDQIRIELRTGITADLRLRLFGLHGLAVDAVVHHGVVGVHHAYDT